MLTLITDKRNP